MIEDLWKSVKATLYDRTTSPLFGTLILSWLAWNYRLIVVLFSSQGPVEKFQYIDTILYPDWKVVGLFFVLFPGLTAAAFLFLYPYPAKFVYEFWRKRQRDLKKVRQEIEDETPLTLEESRQLRREIIDLRREYETELSQTADEASETRDRLVEEQEENTKLRERIARLQSETEELKEFTSPVSVQLDEPISEETLLRYSKWRFPWLPASEDVTHRLLADLDREKYRTLADIQKVVNAAEPAVAIYAKENPDYFKYGTDRITKSLGFVDQDFRDQHGFSNQTMAAFRQHGGKVEEIMIN